MYGIHRSILLSELIIIINSGKTRGIAQVLGELELDSWFLDAQITPRISDNPLSLCASMDELAFRGCFKVAFPGTPLPLDFLNMHV